MITKHPWVDDAPNADLRDRVKQSLATKHLSSLRKLEVTVVGDTVALAGCVPSFHERQLAVALCQHVPGVHRVIDQLDVARRVNREAHCVSGA